MSIGDVVEMEHRFHRDRAEGLSRQALNDREAAIAQRIDAASLDDRTLVARWLDEVNAGDGQRIGRSIDAMIEAMRGFALVGGLLVGAATVAAWLSIESGKPINAVHFWGVLVGLQVALLMVALLAVVSPGAVRRVLSGPGRAVAAVIGWVATRFFRGQKQTLQFAAGLARQYARLYGPVRLWLFMQIAQLFAVMLNVGFIATFIALAVFSDPAFGWRSTLLSDEATHRATQVIAMPWAWAMPDATLTLEEVKATRYSSLDPTFIERFSAQRGAGVWAAWWPFLLASLIVYGLLPRLVLAVVSSWRLRRVMAGMPPEHAAVLELRERLRRPHIDTRAMQEEHAGDAAHSAATVMEQPVDARQVVVLAWSGVEGTDDALSERVASRLGASVQTVHRVGGMDAAADRAALDAVRQAGADVATAFIVEAWEPPVGEYVDFVRALRDASGTSRPIVVMLWPQRGSTQPRDAQVAQWRVHLAAVGDPYLRVVPLSAEVRS